MIGRLAPPGSAQIMASQSDYRCLERRAASRSFWQLNFPLNTGNPTDDGVQLDSQEFSRRRGTRDLADSAKLALGICRQIEPNAWSGLESSKGVVVEITLSQEIVGDNWKLRFS